MVFQKKPPPWIKPRKKKPDDDPDEIFMGTQVGAESGLLPPGIKVADPNDDDYSLLCSACFQTCSGKSAHVIPWWNTTMSDFFTTFRCDKCWLDSLSETESKVRRMTSDIRFRFCEFLRRHKLTALAAEVEAAPLAKSTEMLMAFLGKVRSGEVALKP